MKCMERGDFYEDDEPVEEIVAAFNAGKKVLTAPPVEQQRGWTSYFKLRADHEPEVTYTVSATRARLA